MQGVEKERLREEESISSQYHPESGHPVLELLSDAVVLVDPTICRHQL